ncbi:MAG: MOSC domain-containing protein [Clostridia bacterium]|nr:MOSC domain-containing protein [Clostridia bacterium]
MAKVVAVCRSEKKGEPKRNIGEGLLLENFGLEGDAHAGNWHRQLSMLALESIAKMQQKGLEVKPGDFAENLTTEGIELVSLPIGTRLQIGSNIQVEVTQIGKECHQGCKIMQITGECVMPKEGIFVRVLKGGLVKMGDSVKILA